MEIDNVIIHLREVMDLKFSNIELKLQLNEKALELQAKETERRLENLNGEAGRLREIQSNYIPREVFDRVTTDQRIKTEALQKIVYIGLGIAMILQIAVVFALKFIK